MPIIKPAPLSRLGSLQGSVNLWLEKFLPATRSAEITLPDYKLITILKPQTDKIGFTIGLYQDLKSDKKVIIKSVNYHTPHLLYRLLLNEAYMLTFMNQSLKQNELFMPQFEKLVTDGSHLHLVESYVEAKFNSLTPHQYLTTFSQITQIFSEIDTQKNTTLPKQTIVSTSLWVIIYGAMCIIKQPNKLNEYLQLLGLYFSNLHVHDLLNSELEICHRDLTVENVASLKNKPALIDFESVALAEKLTTLSLLPRSSVGLLSSTELLLFLKTQVMTDRQKRVFNRLSIFYSLQFFAGEPKSSHFYTREMSFLNFLKSELLPHFVSEGETFYEKLQVVLLHLAAKFSGPVQSTILCYHSVNQTDWRFSTSPADFEAQVIFLKKHFHVTTLSEVLAASKPEKPLAAITFDDGYADLMEFALPILEKHHFTASLFVLGNRDSANRDELGNQLPLLTTAQIKTLQQKGWEIGFHTATHADLANLSPQELTAEITTGKNQAEKELGFKLPYFAYPRGMYNQQIKETVHQSGFLAAFTVDGNQLNLADNLAISRIPMEGNASLTELKSLVSQPGQTLQHVLLWALQQKVKLINQLAN